MTAYPPSSLPDPIAWRDGMTLRPQDVGLRADRPFRFCTLHYNHEAHPPVLFGDDPQPTATRALEYYVESRSRERAVPTHSHGFYEIMLVHHGAAQHLSAEGAHEISRGDVIVMAPGASHGYRDFREFTKTNLYIQPEWFFDDLRLLWWEDGLVRHLLATALFELPHEMRLFRLEASHDMMQRCERELSDMRQEAQSPRPSLLAFHAGFLKILHALNRAFYADFCECPAPLEEHVWRAAQHMEACLERGTPMRVKDLAAAAGMSPTYFARVFAEATGQPPTDYFQRRRIQHALRLLLEPSRSATEIAHHLGFSDAAHFSRSFKKATGESPRSYRQRRSRQVPPAV